MHPFRAAVEAEDLDAMVDTLADDVTMHSPFGFVPFAGKDAAAQVLGAVLDTLTDFHYVAEADGDVHVLRFRAKVRGVEEVDGVDIITTGPDGKITDLTVMLRPANALMAMGAAMAPQVEGAAKGRAA